jgi:hypothetical protein
MMTRTQSAELLEVVRELAETPWGEIHIKRLQSKAQNLLSQIDAGTCSTCNNEGDIAAVEAGVEWPRRGRLTCPDCGGMATAVR